MIYKYTFQVILFGVDIVGEINISKSFRYWQRQNLVLEQYGYGQTKPNASSLQVSQFCKLVFDFLVQINILGGQRLL